MKTDRSADPKRVHIAGMDVVNEECIWMKAGVVQFRLCDNAFDCSTCPFDTGMKRSFQSADGSQGAGRGSDWQESLRKRYGGGELFCRHYLTGRISNAKVCPNSYECHRCQYDQWLDEYDLKKKTAIPLLKPAAGYLVPDDYYLHQGHAWAGFQHGGFARVGFDDFMVKLFGPVDRLELPGIGSRIKQGQPFLTFHRDGKSAQVRTPVTGTVLAVNHAVAAHPDIAHADPYGEGWLLIVDADMPKRNLKRLSQGEDSVRFLEREASRLMALVSPEYAGMAATGGVPVDDVVGTVPGLDWDCLKAEFLEH